MQVLARRIRMATSTPHCAYDLLVPLSEVPEAVAPHLTHVTVMPDRHGWDKRFVFFPDATQTAEHATSPRGLERWERWERHRRAAEAIASNILRRAFPEIGERNPFDLWLSSDDLQSAEVWLDA